MPPLRDRKEDIYLLFRKFALDFADKYMMPVIKLNPLAQEVLESYRWPGNVRQLKSVAEQISVLEHERLISAEVLKKYLPLDRADKLPVRTADAHANADYTGDRDIIFKILFQLRKDVDDLKAQMGEGEVQDDSSSQTSLVNPLLIKPEDIKEVDHFSIQEVNADLIKKALEKHGGKRKAAAEELGISERTLYRKIKELGID
jgi:DNA-binding NtrC family response regulator